MEERIQKMEETLLTIQSILMGDKKVLSLDEGCMLTGYSKSYMYKLTASESIPHYKRGKKVFFDKEEIEAWLRYNKVTDVTTKAKKLVAKI